MSDATDHTVSDAQQTLNDEAALDAWIGAQRAAVPEGVRDNFLKLSQAEQGAIIARLEVRHGSRSPVRLICLFVLALAVSVAVLLLAGGAGVRTLGLLTAGGAGVIVSVILLADFGANAWKKELAVKLRLIYDEGQTQR